MMVNSIRSAVGAVLAASICVASASVAGKATDHGELRHKSGLVLMGPGPYQSIPKDEAQAQAFDRALRLAAANPKDLGYPWVDPAGRLVQRHKSEHGRQLGATSQDGAPAANEYVARSFEELETIKHDIALLDGLGVPGAKAIVRVEPDDAKGRIVVSVNKLDEQLLSTLVGLYGTDAVAVRFDPSLKRLTPQAATRGNDLAPYSAGARWLGTGWPGCTLGVPWTTGFLTAGHCIPGGGAPYSPSGAPIGITRSGYDENWVSDYGTVMWAGDNVTFRGDIALIKADGNLVSPQIYVGDETSSTKRWVTRYWDRAPEINNQYCVGGATTGEICGWVVWSTRGEDVYADGSIARNVTIGRKLGGDGTASGDSGGPVYTVQGDGTVSIMGVHSAHSFNGTYHYESFTDVSLIVDSVLPGFVKTADLGSKRRIQNLNSNKCLAIRSSSKANGANAIQYQCIDGSQGQTWYLVPHPTTYNWYWIKNGSGKCLAIGGSSAENGAEAIQWDCIETSVGQRWLPHPDGSISNGSGKCLAIGSGSMEDSAKAIQWQCIGSGAQKWALGYQP